jgi:hypothetical protein
MSGGADYDGKPGHDGVTVHVRPYDADGYTVKAPGRIEVQLTDLTDPSNPQTLAVCTIHDAEELRESWYGRFWTDHYTIKCPFKAGAGPPESGKVVVRAKFVDYLTGKTLTDVQEVEVIAPGATPRDPGSDASSD